MHGQCMGSAWAVHGLCMGCAWAVHGLCMGSAWVCHVLCARVQCIGKCSVLMRTVRQSMGSAWHVWCA